MLCPSCQKKLTKLLHEKLTKSRSAVERIRICSCGFKFKSFERAGKEIVKDKKKEKPSRVKWREERFNLYIAQRTADVLPFLKNTLNKFSKYEIKKFNIYFTKAMPNESVLWIDLMDGDHVRAVRVMSKRKSVKNVIKLKLYEELKIKYNPKTKMNKSYDKKKKEIESLYNLINQYVGWGEFTIERIKKGLNKYKSIYNFSGKLINNDVMIRILKGTF